LFLFNVFDSGLELTREKYIIHASKKNF